MGMNIDANLIDAGDNDRTSFDVSELQVLADSIASLGCQYPPIVRLKSDGRFEIVAGERRTRAMRDVLGWQEIPCVLKDLTDGEASAIMLAENLARKDLDPMQEALAYAKRSDLKPEAIAKQAGVTADRVRRRLELLKLTDSVRGLVARGQLGLKVAELLCKLDADRQVIAVDTLHKENLDYQGMAILCERLHLAQCSASMFDVDTFLQSPEIVERTTIKRMNRQELENSLSDALRRLETLGVASDSMNVRASGSRGGAARAAKLSSAERSEIARKAARARWTKVAS